MAHRLRNQDRRDATDPVSLRPSERSRFSQNGEDGVIDEVMRRIGTASRTFVEIGASDGRENCTRALVEQGWTGAWVEATQTVPAVPRRRRRRHSGR